MIIKQKIFSINGLDMHVELAGVGQPLLLLHGFPDSGQLWRVLLPRLVEAGFRVIIPDQRGFGLTTAPSEIAAYSEMQIASDAIALLDTLGIEKAALMAHDFGSIIGWRLAADHPDRFSRFVALSVGHPNAIAAAGLRQKIKSWYVVLFQLRGFAEAVVRAGNFTLLRWITRNEPEIAIWQQDLARPGRLTAAMNWYRANFAALIKGEFPPARIPVLGFIGAVDVALTETQMALSARYVEAPFAYHLIKGAGHWIPLHAATEIEGRAIEFLLSLE